MDQGMRGRMLAGIFDLLLMEDEPRRALLDFEVPNHRSYGATLEGYQVLFEGLATVLAAQDPDNSAGQAALQARCARILEDIEARRP
jgi:outer membrane protein TolC